MKPRVSDEFVVIAGLAPLPEREIIFNLLYVAFTSSFNH